jgi:RNA polymerase sigma-70 factor, ECF subfamily
MATLMKPDKTADFRTLVDTHQDRVFNICYGFFRNREDSEDAAQEVFMEIFRSLSRFRDEAQLSTWIYRIAVTKCIDILRKRNRQKRFGRLQSQLGLANQPERLPDRRGLNPEQTAEVAERSQILHQAIAFLPENQRVAITLSQIEGFSQKEIAALMAITVPAVEALIHRAKKNLYHRLVAYYKNLS